MQNIFRSLSFTIVQNVYTLFPELYAIFTKLASARYFTEENIRAMSQNLYIVMCVCMLFALGIRLINAIVNPAMLDGGGDAKNKKSVKHTFINSLLAVLLIVLIPMGFDLLYQVQDNLVEQHWIEKVVLGIDNTDSDQNAGQIIAAYAFYSFCQPNTDKDISVEAFSEAGGDIYNKAITEDINYLKQMDSVINSKTDGEYDLQYNPILAPAVGIYIFYQLILLCMDMALRMFKLGLLELITPIILCGFLFQGSDLLQKWFKEVMKTYVLVYLKIALVAFMVYGLSLLNGFFTRTDANGDKLFEYVRPDGTTSIFFTGIIRTFVIIGLLQLVKQIPDLINSIFGSNIKSRGGISGRLGEMAAVGKLAQKGWDTLRQHPIQTSQRMISAPISAVGGGIAHNVAAANRARRMLANGGWRDIRNWANAAGTMAGGALTTGGAVIRGGRSGWQNRNLQGIGAQGARYEQTHQQGSTFGGRVRDTISTALGGTTAHQDDEARIKRMPFRFRNRDYNEDQFNAINEAYTQNQQLIENARNKASEIIEHVGSQRAMNIGFDYQDSVGNTHHVNRNAANYATLKNQLDDLRNSAPVRGEHESAAAYEARLQTHNNMVAAFNAALINDAITRGAAAGNGGREQAGCVEIQNAINDVSRSMQENLITDADGNGFTRINAAGDVVAVDTITNVNDLNAVRDSLNISVVDLAHSKQDRTNRVNEQRTSDRYNEHLQNENSINGANNNGGNSGSGGSGH